MPDPKTLTNEALADALGELLNDPAVELPCSYIEDVEEVCRRLRALSPRPIEEPPKDGTRIMAVRRRTFHSEQITSWIGPPHNRWRDWNGLDPTHWYDLSALEVPSDKP